MAVRRDDVIEAVNTLGADGKVFQSRDIRKHLRIEASDGNAASRLHALLKGLEADRVIELLPSERKRNRNYQIASDTDTDIPPGRPRPKARGGAADRLSRMETKMTTIEKRLAEIERSLATLVDILQ